MRRSDWGWGNPSQTKAVEVHGYSGGDPGAKVSVRRFTRSRPGFRQDPVCSSPPPTQATARPQACQTTMSLQVNLSSRDLLTAYQNVVNANGIDWALFTYDKGSNDLKVQSTGDGGLEELEEEFSDGR